MKYLYRISLAVLLLFVGYACTDLDESLNSDFTESFDPNNPGFGESTNVNGSVPNDGLNAAFGALRNGTANHGGYFSVTEIPTDEAVITQKGGDWFDGGIWLNMHRHDFRDTNPGLNGAWTQNYGGVTQINTLLEAGGLDANQVAQLRVLRAYFIWRLQDLFGRVKLPTEGNPDPPQASRVDAFNFIVSEIQAALPDLSDNAGYGRISTGAANALLARVYLNGEVYTRSNANSWAAGTGDLTCGTLASTCWAEAEFYADEVINSGIYELDTAEGWEERVFGPANVDATGHIFIVPFDEATGGGMNFAQMTLHYPSQLTYDLQQQPWNGYSTLEEFYNSYDDADSRKEAFFIEGPQFDLNGNPILDVAFDQADPDGAPVNYTPFINELAPNGSRQAGARMGKFSFKIGQLPDMDNDFPLIRYAEVLMIKAEAVARQANDWNAALPWVNQLRARAGLPAATSLTEDEFLAELGREFFQESKRRTDLIRFDKWGDAWWEKSAHNDSYKNVMPIPLDQINVPGSGLTQNAGY